MSSSHEDAAGIEECELLTGYPDATDLSADDIAARIADAHSLVVLDDDPTGTQSVADIPVVTAWEPDDIRWALSQDTSGFYVLSNTRSLSPEAAAERDTEILDAVLQAAAEQQTDVALVSRSDSTLRGHFPLETDVLADRLAATGRRVDAVALIPAFTDAGRITIDSTHWVKTPGGMVTADQTEFARDPEFGYIASTLPAYVEEKSRGRWSSSDVARITLTDLRGGDLSPIVTQLMSLRERHPVVVDAVCDEDLRVFTLAAIEAERRGATLLYRTGPSFVRNRLGQSRHAAVSDAALHAVLEQMSATEPLEPDQSTSPHGLVAAGSYVGLTTSQLEGLYELDGIRRFTLDVAEMLTDTADRECRTEELAVQVAGALESSDVVLATSRKRMAATDNATSRAIQADVSAMLVEVVRRAVTRCRPRWVVAKGGITSSDLATRSLGIRRAWIRGTLLPGIVSLWEPANPDAQRVPYVVFAGNVGNAESLREVVTRLRERS